MATLVLCKLDYSIDRTNTLWFNNANTQYTYFRNKSVFTKETNYVPYYRNIIKLSVSDFDYNAECCNYALLHFGDKVYYYFIDTINYINSNVYNLELTMDTIQTYMFDIRCNGIITRQTIKRFNGELFNRNYVRENLSKSDVFNSVYYRPVEENIIYIIEASRPIGDITDSDITRTRFRGDNDIISYENYYYLVFNDEITNARAVMDNNMTRTKPIITQSKALHYFASNPYTLTIREFRIPIEQMQIMIDDNLVTLPNYMTLTPLEDSEDYIVFLGKYNSSTFPIDVYSCNYREGFFPEIEFVQNTTLDTDFDIKYIPYLYDTNYIEYSIGNKSTRSYAPLELYNSNNSVEIYYDIFACSKRYDFEKQVNIPTFAIYNGELSYTIINDNYKYFLASNKGSNTIGIALQEYNANYDKEVNRINNEAQMQKNAINASTGFASSAGTLAAGIIMGNPMGIASGAGGMLQSAGNAANTAIDYHKNEVLRGMQYDNAMYNIHTNLEINKTNALYTPNTIKSGNNSYDDLLYNETGSYFLARYVSDIETVAREIEYNGYAVNVMQNEYKLAFSPDDNIRYYFNVKAMKVMSTKVDNTVIPDIMLQNFINRLENGIRVWNNNENRALQYDNVEREVITIE